MPAGLGISRQKRKFHLVFHGNRRTIGAVMRHLAAIGAFCFLLTGSLASAQIQISAQTERTDYLLYERVDLLVTIANASENDIVLDNDEGRSWLSFVVTKPNRLPVHSERQSTFKGITLKVGETKTLRVNVTPLFSFREEGSYRVAAVIDLPGAGEIVSDPVPFNVLRGRTVWSQTRPLDGSQRVYSLIRFSPNPNKTNLYLRVEDPGANIVLANLSLGQVVAYVDPEVFFDPQGNVHVLQPISMGTYLYSRTDQAGKVVHQGIFKTYQTVPPRLTKLDDGNVIVVGGLEENPDAPRETLSGGEKLGRRPANGQGSGLPPPLRNLIHPRQTRPLPATRRREASDPRRLKKLTPWANLRPVFALPFDGVSPTKHAGKRIASKTLL